MISTLVLIIELLVLAFFKAVGVDSRPDSVMVLLIFLFSFTYVIEKLASKETKIIKFAFIGGYLFRVALLLWDIFGSDIYRLPDSGYDSVVFYKSAVRIANGEAWKVFDISIFAGNVFKVIGISKLFMQFLFLIFSIISVHALNEILKLLKLSHRYRQISILVASFLPNYAILSVLFLRESMIIMLVSLSLWMFVKWKEFKNELYFVLSIVPILLASMLHSGVMGVIVGYVFVRLFYSNSGQKFQINLNSIVYAAFATALLVFLFMNYSDVFFGKMQDVTEISDIGNTYDMGGSSYAKYVGNSDSLGNLLIYTPIRVIMFMFSPFIWQIRGIPDIIALLFNSLFYIYVWYK